MKTVKWVFNRLNFFSFAALAALLLAGCGSSPEKSASQPGAATGTKPALPTIRIKTGVSDGFTDNSGNKWLPDQGFADGETVDRPDVAIVGTSDPEIYRAERY